MTGPVIIRRIGHMENGEYVCDEATAVVADEDGIIGKGVAATDEAAGKAAQKDLKGKRERARLAHEAARRRRGEL